MKKIKKDEVYVVNQPKHSIMSFVFVDPTHKDRNWSTFMSNCHDTVLKLAEETDVMFIFKNTEGINPDTFSKVYGASSWIIAEDNLAKTYLKAISYAIIIFKDPVGFLTLDTTDYLYTIDINKIRQVAGSSLSWPIFKAKHLDSDEMYAIYKKDDLAKPWWTWGQKRRNGTEREYTTWKMTSDLAFFRPSLFSKLDSLSDEYVNSFTWNHIGYFLASSCEYLGIKRIDYSICDLNVNRLSDYVDAEGKE